MLKSLLRRLRTPSNNKQISIRGLSISR